MEKSQTTIFVILALIICLGIIVFIFLIPTPTVGPIECVRDADCVPASCCHADSCVPNSEAPSCDGVFCTQECQPGTLDCNQASCSCLNNKCQTKRNEGQ